MSKNKAIAKQIADRDVFIFSKSGNTVRILEIAEPYRGQTCVTVERVDTGKRMYVPYTALLSPGMI